METFVLELTVEKLLQPGNVWGLGFDWGLDPSLVRDTPTPHPTEGLYVRVFAILKLKVREF